VLQEKTLGKGKRGNSVEEKKNSERRKKGNNEEARQERRTGTKGKTEQCVMKAKKKLQSDPHKK